jgi:flagellar basal-body rod modification protein FlgD
MTISSTAPVGGGSAGQSSNIGIQDFLKILTAQLNNQDPLKPVDNQEFVAQIAQFATLVKIDSLLSVQSATQSIGLLAKTVDFNQDGSVVTGQVTALSLDSGQPLLTVKTAAGAFQNGVTIAQIINIR